jgi:hypothetical protein
MKILTLIDELDDLIHNARPIPLTDQVRVDKEAIFDILDQMRVEVPEIAAQARAGGSEAAGGLDRQALTEAVSAAIKENIPDIARAAAAATTSSRSGPSTPPPGAPF